MRDKGWTKNAELVTTITKKKMMATRRLDETSYHGKNGRSQKTQWMRKFGEDDKKDGSELSSQ